MKNDHEITELPKSEWENCPCCPNEGCYMEGYYSYVTHDMALDAGYPEMEGMLCGEPEVIQCEFCWTNPKSVFYQQNKLWRKEHNDKNRICKNT